MKPKEFIRWATFLAFGGFGIYTLVAGLWGIVAGSDGNWIGTLFVLSITTIFSGVPLAISYLALRREYHAIFATVAAIGAVIVFSVLFSLPDKLGLGELYAVGSTRSPWLGIIGLPLLLLSFLVPFYTAWQFFRIVMKLVDRLSGGNSTAEPVI